MILKCKVVFLLYSFSLPVMEYVICCLMSFFRHGNNSFSQASPLLRGLMPQLVVDSSSLRTATCLLAYGLGLDKRFTNFMYHTPPQDAMRTQLTLRFFESQEKGQQLMSIGRDGAQVGIVAPLGRERGSQKASEKVKMWEEMKSCRK